MTKQQTVCTESVFSAKKQVLFFEKFLDDTFKYWFENHQIHLLQKDFSKIDKFFLALIQSQRWIGNEIKSADIYNIN